MRIISLLLLIFLITICSPAYASDFQNFGRIKQTSEYIGRYSDDFIFYSHKTVTFVYQIRQNPDDSTTEKRIVGRTPYCSREGTYEKRYYNAIGLPYLGWWYGRNTPYRADFTNASAFELLKYVCANARFIVD